MTSNKYTPFESKLENTLKSIDARVNEIKGMVAGMYDQIIELEHTAEAVYKTVNCHPRESAYVPDDDWDFLNEEE
jgi:archaellum component FlaC